MSRLLFLLFCLNASCSSPETDFDEDGRLMLTKLLSSSGSLSFAPMESSDSISVMTFKPDTFFYKNKPYNGRIAYYDNFEKLLIDGELLNGIANGNWKFYFASGGLRIQGDYRNGYEYGIWKSYYGYNKLKIVKHYDEDGFMLMRKEYYNDGSLKNYQNIKCEQYGNLERRIHFNKSGEMEYIDVEDSLKRATANKIIDKIENNSFTKTGISN
ncbi:MAG: hypothetical protein H7Y00_11540 [Fimbriimonadaceae bacterium]|nr:hypothetical protein [Chitinophagales bacterium]